MENIAKNDQNSPKLQKYPTTPENDQNIPNGQNSPK